MQPKYGISVHTNKLIFGSSILTIGVILLVHSTSIFTVMVELVYKMYPGSFSYNIWKKYPMPLRLYGYYFNWTNPHEIYTHGVKPKFTQMGPYVFDEDREKINITFNNNNTITYMQRRIYRFNRELSVGPMSDQVTSLNPVSFSAAHKIRNWSYFMKKGFSISVASLAPKIHITRSVGEVLFQGYFDPLVKMANHMPFLLQDTDLDIDVSDGNFAWFKPMNDTAAFNGVFNMALNDHPEGFGKLLRWNYRDTLKVQEGKCAEVGGSAGEFYPPLDDLQRIGIFSSEICQVVKMDYKKEQEVSGILGRRYDIGAGFLDNGTFVPENQCYCHGECLPSGVVNVSACRYGTPSFVSLPHFHLADPSYRDAVEGMDPKDEEHDFYIVFEPKTRVPLKLKGALQLNLLLHPIDHITMYENVPKIMMPILWFGLEAQVPTWIEALLKCILLVPTSNIIFGTLFVLLGLSVYAFIVYKELKCRYTRIYATQLTRLNCEPTFIGRDQVKSKLEGNPLEKEAFINSNGLMV